MSKIATVGKKVPAFSGPVTGEQKLALKDFKGKNLVIYFYPRDNTPGCTQEGKDFSENYKKFTKLNTDIIGVSQDSLKKHENFKAKYDFPFELLSDEDGSVCEVFDVIHAKKMYGKEFMGIVRSTFLIDAEGKLVQEWRKVKVNGHVDEVLEAVKAISQ